MREDRELVPHRRDIGHANHGGRMLDVMGVAVRKAVRGPAVEALGQRERAVVLGVPAAGDASLLDVHAVLEHELVRRLLLEVGEEAERRAEVAEARAAAAESSLAMARRREAALEAKALSLQQRLAAVEVKLAVANMAAWNSANRA